MRNASRSSSFRSGEFLRRAAVAAAATFCALAASAHVSPASQAEGRIASGRVLVMPRAGISDEAMNTIAKGVGSNKVRRVGRSELRVLELPPGQERQAVERLARHPHVKFAELDVLVQPDAAPNDPYAGAQWHLGRIGALTAWDMTQGAGVTIAVLDTGVEASHPDLASSLVAGWNFHNNSADISDPYNHGTGVAGAAAASMNNAMGVAGVAGLSRIMPIRITDATGYASFSAMAQGLTHAADKGARVANISFSSAARSASVISAAQYMKNKGGLVFVSAGNTGAPATGSPTTSMIVVGGTSSDDVRASWSTYGPVVSLASPGVGIYTTRVGGGYVSDNGTSFASPVAAGVAALVMALKPSLSSAQVENILFSTAVDLGAPGRDDYYGYGRVDAAKAVQAALATGAPVDTQPPTVSISGLTSGATVSGLIPINVVVSDNVGVVRVELKVNGALVATDTTAPLGFSWDSSLNANGMSSLSVVAYDAAGNAATSASVSVNVANHSGTDTTAPTVRFLNPVNGSRVSGGSVSIDVSAADDRGAAGIRQTLYINDIAVASATGGVLTFKWNTRKLDAGTYVLRAVTRDAAGNVGEAISTVLR